MTTKFDDDAAYLELIAGRFEFLATLDGNHLDKRALTDAVPYSRSTVDRAIRDLSAAGLVVHTSSGYTASLKGQYLFTLFDSYRRDVRDVLELDAAISTQTGQFPLPVDALLGADVIVATEQFPHRPLQFLTEKIERTDYGTVVMRRLPNQTFVKELTKWLSSGHACRVITSETVVTEIWHESPEVLECMQAASECDLRVGTVPPYGLSYTVVRGEARSTAVMYDEGRIQSVISNTSDSAVTWAREYTQSLWNDAKPFDLEGYFDSATEGDAPGETETGASLGTESTDSTEQTDTGQYTVDSQEQSDSELASTVTATTTDNAVANNVSLSRHGQPLPTKLQSQGFVRLSPEYFDRGGVSPPLACWRAGFDLGEVRVGYALDRERPTEDGRENVTNELFTALRDATDHVVVGPPGAGKSTVCMSVACQWYDQQLGPVIYRKSGHRDGFSATAHLGSYLAEAPGHTLVVVEDSTRAEANAVFELVREFADDDHVTFLLDSRENEWQNDQLVGAARLESHRTYAIKECTVPPVDSHERKRVIDHFEATVDKPVDIDPDNFQTGDDEFAPGEMYLFLHRLARHVEPTSADETGPTSLVDDIDGVYKDLRAIGDLAIDVGVLVNLLNAAGVSVDIPLVYVIASTREEESIVEDALNELERSVLYSAFGSDETETVRTVHETWSARFLQRLLQVESERQARRRFEDCLGALFSLIDEESTRAAVQSVFGGTADSIRAIGDDPSGWGNRLVKNVFELGVNNPTLSSLYAETAYSQIEIPHSFDPSLALDVRRWRARMFINGGELGRAMREFESLAELTESSFESRTFAGDAIVSAQADGLAGVSEVLRHRGEYDASKDAAESALELFERLDDDIGRSDVLNTLGTIEARRGKYERGIEYLEDALTLRREAKHKTKIASTLSNLAKEEIALNMYERAREHAQESLQIRQQIGYRWGESLSLSTLGVIEMEIENFDRAEQYTRSALNIRRSIGDSMGIASSLNNLAGIEFNRGQRSDAYSRYTKLIEWLEKEEFEFDWIQAHAHYGFAEVLLERGDAEAALEHADTALDVIEDENTQIELHSIRALATLDCGALVEAKEIATDTFDRTHASDSEQRVYASIALGRTLVERGEKERGLEYLTSAVDAAPTSILKGRSLSILGDVYDTLGHTHDAIRVFDDAAACFSDVNAGGRVREIVEKALSLADECNDTELRLSLEEYTVN